MLRKVLGTAVTTVLVVAAVGLAAWFLYAAKTGATLITFRTGSMAPSMPQGSAAVAVPVKADALQIGDVITVQRAGDDMPVTHRIIEISEVQERSDNAADIRAAAPGKGPPDSTSEQARQIIMQGDDNRHPDHLPYVVTDAYKVVVAIPYLGMALTLLQTPLGTGTMIILVGALVTWAFWPQSTNVQAPVSTTRTPKHAA